jgi:hypothetical protein
MPSIYQDKPYRLQRSEWKFHSGGNASSEQLDRRQSGEAVPLFGTRIRLGLVRLDLGFIAKSGFRLRLHGGRFGFELEMMVLGFAVLACLAGISCNKSLAKIASDYRKPNGQFAILPKKLRPSWRRFRSLSSMA